MFFKLLIFINLLNYLYATVTVYNEKNQSIEIIEDFSARFGPRLPEDGFKGYLAVAKPINGCMPIESPPNISYVDKWIALIQRTQNYNGNCSFDLKVLNAQNAGFSAVIVFNSDSDHLVRMSSSGSYNIKIPSVFIGHSDGIELQNYYTYLNKTYLVITEDDTVTSYLIPFAIIVGSCFIIMITIFVIKCAIYYHKTHKNRISKSALKKIPTKKYQKSDKYDTCPICLDEYEEGVKIRILPCEHVYHIKCIDEWLLKNNRSCPVCKRKVLPGDDSDEESETRGNDESVNRNNQEQRQQQQQAQTQHIVDETDQNLIDTTNDDDFENDSETSRLLNPTSTTSTNQRNTVKSTIVSLIPNQTNSKQNLENNNNLSTSVISSGSNGSQYGSITQLDNIASSTSAAAVATASVSPQIKIDLNLPPIFSKKQKTSKRKSNKKKKEKQSQASALLKSDESSDDELIEISDQTNNDDTTLLIPDVQTNNNNQESNKTSKNKKDFVKSV